MSEINNAENPQLQEIQELERQLAEKKAAISIESSMEQLELKPEIGQENIPKAPIQTPAPSSITQAASTPIKKDAKKREAAQDARSIATMDENRKIETLVAIALEEGITHSIAVANNLQDPYILDTLHDKLIGELHDRLVQEKRLKEL